MLIYTSESIGSVPLNRPVRALIGITQRTAIDQYRVIRDAIYTFLLQLSSLCISLSRSLIRSRAPARTILDFYVIRAGGFSIRQLN